MATTTIRTKTPCCGRNVRIAAIVGVRSEQYDRTCRECGTTWNVKRVMLTDGDVRIDRVEWLDKGSREYMRTYGR